MVVLMMQAARQTTLASHRDKGGVMEGQHMVTCECNRCIEERSRYAGWALSLIALIAGDERIHSAIRCEEIKTVINHDGTWQDSFNDGDSPALAWDAEVESIIASV